MTLDPDRNRLPLGSEAAGAVERPSPLRGRSGLAAALAVLACTGCCAVPILVPLGVLTAGGVAAATTGLTVVAAILFGVAVLLWVLHRRTTRRALEPHGCAGNCTRSR